MSEAGADSTGALQALQPSAGTLLRRAREAAGLHVAALAVSLKVPVRTLEALEQDQLELLPDAVFARALAASVCRALKMDPQAVLERMPQGNMPRLGQDRDRINTPFRVHGQVSRPAWRDHLAKPPVMVASVLVVGALVLLAMPLFPSLPSAVPVDTTAAAQLPAVGTTDAATAPATGSTTTETVPFRPVEPPAPVSASSAPLAPVLAVVAPPAVPGSAAQRESDPAAVAEGVVVFRAKAPSWIQVTDARGAVSLRRLLAAGEAVGASGELPLSVTVGSAGSTEVQVRGRPFDLAPVSRDNVARFEVK